MEIENTNQPQTPVQSPNQGQAPQSEDQPKQSKKFIIILAIIIALFFFGIGGYLLGTNKNQSISQYQQVTGPSANIVRPSSTSTPAPIEDSTANWKVYTSADYGISLKYPADAVASTETLYSMLSKSSKNGLDIAPPYQEPYSKWYAFDLVVQDNPQNLDAKTIINNYVEDIKKNCSPPACSTPKMIADTLKPYKNREINGYIFHIGAETDSAMVIHVKSNKTYIFRMSGDQGNVTDYGLNIFDQILSTLKFTK